NPDQAALEAGFENLKWHINNVHKYGLPAVVAINQFPQDCVKELKALEDLIHQFNPEVKVAISTAFSQGGQGATELAQHVIDACTTPVEFCPLYNKEQSLLEKLMAVCEAGYGATNIEMTPIATEQLKHFEQLGFNNLAVCIAKT
ncbi:formate--tetrahydrofolate ligase, partial [Vibrio parahaemolyticus]